MRKGIGRGALAVLAVGIAAVPIGLLLGGVLHLGPPALLVVLLAGSSAAVAFPIIEEKQLKGPSVSYLVAWIALADSITVVLMPLTLGGGNLLSALGGDALVIGVGILVLLVATRVAHTRVAGALATESKDRGWALQLRLSVLLLLVLATIADRTGASTLVAGFVAGMIVIRLHEPDRLTVQISGVANGFFVPLFFVLLGARLDLRSLVSEPKAIALAAGLAVGALLIHVAASLVTGVGRRVPTGLAASAQLGLPAAAASLGLATHALRPSTAAALVAAGCLTLLPAALGASRISIPGRKR